MEANAAASRAAPFLPDFCDIRVVFAVVLAGELLALVLALMSVPALDFWQALGGTSLFVQWVGLTAAAVLCASGRRLSSLRPAATSVLVLGLVVALTALLSLITLWLLDESLVPPRVSPAGWGFLARNVAVGGLVGAVALRYLYVQHQWRQNLAREASARVQALQARIRPHFLFNSMNTIASLTRTSPALAERVVEDLADLFRVSLGDARVPATLGRELEVSRRYLDIEALRLGDRLETRWEVGGLPANALLPPLTVQPLLENAVYHGVEPAPEGGLVRVSGRLADGVVELRVENPLPPAGAPPRNGNRIAQDNVRQRLEAFFGKAAGLEAGPVEGRYVAVLRFPMREQMR
jgi:two-component system sensor histidine kinase AlgZ